ncbi:MAG: glutamine-hydrolyzing GMP synthase, partial [Deltaproteobacteria bacterium]|nr:glutamine-hydrolyzing GMP synthase [Deltaproteobacteria bacterium]
MDKILILDFGSQYTQLIARRIREQQVYCEIHPYNYSIEKIKDFQPKAIVLSGGPSSVYAENAPRLDPSFFDLSYPMLGICYGMQLMGKMLGGKVEASSRREYGRAMVEVDDSKDFFKGVKSKTQVWMSHGDHVVQVPSGFEKIGHSENSPIAAMAHRAQKKFAVQFHPEVTHSEEGTQIIRNFLFEIAQCQPNWTMKGFIQSEIENIRQKVGKDRVICATSGGVDSTVAAHLVHQAIGDQLT